MKPISNQQLEKFLKEKAPNKCPWCEHEEWAAVGGVGAEDRAASGIVLYDFATNPRHLSAGAYIPTLTTVCTNCGGVREIARHVIEKWLDENENGT
jgi:hypothetical protein